MAWNQMVIKVTNNKQTSKQKMSLKNIYITYYNVVITFWGYFELKNQFKIKIY